MIDTDFGEDPISGTGWVHWRVTADKNDSKLPMNLNLLMNGVRNWQTHMTWWKNSLQKYDGLQKIKKAGMGIDSDQHACRSGTSDHHHYTGDRETSLIFYLKE